MMVEGVAGVLAGKYTALASKRALWTALAWVGIGMLGGAATLASAQQLRARHSAPATTAPRARVEKRSKVTSGCRYQHE